jgi:hypothetical protein
MYLSPTTFKQWTNYHKICMKNMFLVILPLYFAPHQYQHGASANYWSKCTTNNAVS